MTLLFALAACLIGGMVAPAAGRKAAPTIRVAPDKALVDEVVSVSINGLSQGQAATVRATLTDNHRVVWRSEAEFIADRKGVVDLSKHAPSRGGYTGVDPMGLFWSMNIQPGRKLIHGPRRWRFLKTV